MKTKRLKEGGCFGGGACLTRHPSDVGMEGIPGTGGGGGGAMLFSFGGHRGGAAGELVDIGGGTLEGGAASGKLVTGGPAMAELLAVGAVNEDPITRPGGSGERVTGGAVAAVQLVEELVANTAGFSSPEELGPDDAPAAQVKIPHDKKKGQQRANRLFFVGGSQEQIIYSAETPPEV